MKSGFTGISFPFRVSSKGGVEMSTTSADDVSHIVDAIKQILLTGSGERKMEYHFSSGLDSFVFEPNDESLKNLLIYQVNSALQQLEDRIEVKNVDVVCEDNKVYVILTFRVLIYDTEYTEKIEVTKE
jgi:phage baseplate assembly protein W